MKSGLIALRPLRSSFVGKVVGLALVGVVVVLTVVAWRSRSRRIRIPAAVALLACPLIAGAAWPVRPTDRRRGGAP
jgi:hypothetical protein